ncbi:MAG: DMT family transporter [Anaerolineales bacterium]|jgi:drug/metabolite transporter (DMT)-like permease
MSDNSKNWKAYLALLSGLVIIGFSAIFVRLAEAPGPVASFYRMILPSLLLTFPIILRIRDKRIVLPRAAIRAALLGGLFFGLDLSLWASGIMLRGATIPTLMANTAPVWVGIGTVVLLRRRLPGLFWLGLAVAMAGVTIVLGLDAFKEAELGLGSLMGLGAAIFYGAYFLVTQSAREAIDAPTYLWLSSLCSSVVLLIVVGLLGQPLGGYPAQSWWSFLAMGLIVQLMGWLAINYAQGHLPATLVSPTLLGQPVITALLAAPILGEAIGLGQAVGGFVVLVGVYLVHHSRVS